MYALMYVRAFSRAKHLVEINQMLLGNNGFSSLASVSLCRR